MTERFKRVKSTKETIHYGGIEDNENEVIYNYGKQDDFLEDITKLLNELNDENEDLKSQLKNLRQLSNKQYQRIREALANERTAIGKSVLKQLLESMGE